MILATPQPNQKRKERRRKETRTGNQYADLSCGMGILVHALCRSDAVFTDIRKLLPPRTAYIVVSVPKIVWIGDRRGNGMDEEPGIWIHTGMYVSGDLPGVDDGVDAFRRDKVLYNNISTACML